MRASKVNSLGEVWVVIVNLEHKTEVKSLQTNPSRP
jgi:hypothetical protein